MFDDTLEQNLEQLQPEEQPAQETPTETPQIQTQKVNLEDDPGSKFRALQEKNERLEREQYQLAQQVAAMKPQAPIQEPEDDDIRLGPDELAEGKHIAKLHKQLREMKKQLKSYETQTHESLVEARLKAQYPDFDKIVNPANIKALSESDPELAATIYANPDMYTKAVTAYKQIKKMVPMENNYDNEKARVAVNAAKPRPLASVSPQQGDSPLSRANAFANGLTPELQKQLYKEMVDAQKGS